VKCIYLYLRQNNIDLILVIIICNHGADAHTLTERDDLHEVQSLFGVKTISFYSKFVEVTVNNAIFGWCLEET